MRGLPKISIVIPVYNVEEYITDCLQSVMRQTYKGEVECILVDDCGKDKSVEVAEQLINTNNDRMSREQDSLNESHTLNDGIKFRIVHHERNRGLSAARNTGTDVATGDYIYYLDSDDYITDDCIEAMVEPLKEKEYDMVVGRMKMFGEMDEEYIWVDETTAYEGNENVFRAYYADRKMYATAWNRLVKRELFKQYDIAFKEGLLHEDELWSYMLFTRLQSLAIINHRTYYYRIRPNSIVTGATANIGRHIADTYYTAAYVLEHPYEGNKELYSRCAQYYINNFIILASKGKESYCKSYVQLRRKFNYHPWRLLMKGEMSAKEFKHKLHYALPPFLGYWYLRVRQWKNKK